MCSKSLRTLLQDVWKWISYPNAVLKLRHVEEGLGGFSLHWDVRMTHLWYQYAVHVQDSLTGGYCDQQGFKTTTMTPLDDHIRQVSGDHGPWLSNPEPEYKIGLLLKNCFLESRTSKPYSNPSASLTREVIQFVKASGPRCQMMCSWNWMLVRPGHNFGDLVGSLWSSLTKVDDLGQVASSLWTSVSSCVKWGWLSQTLSPITARKIK